MPAQALRFLPWLTLSGLIVVCSVVFLSLPGAANTVIKPLPQALPVQTLKLEKLSHYQVKERYSGSIQARQRSMLGFDRPGLLQKILVEEGQRVQAGQMLAILDKRLLVKRLAVLKARKEAIAAGLVETAARLTLARSTNKRHQKLAVQGKLAQQAADESATKFIAAKARQNAQEAKARQVAAEIEEVQVNRALSDLKAPFSGRIAKRWLDTGTPVAAGQVVLSLVEDQHLQAHIGIPLKFSQDLIIGQFYKLVVNGESLNSELRHLLPAIDVNSRTVPAIFRLRVENTKYRLLDGQMVHLELQRTVRQSGFWLPLSSLTEGKRGLWTSYAVIKSNTNYRIEKRALQIQHIEAERVFVTGTLENGDQLVQNGLHRLTAGQRVQPTGESNEES